MINPKELLANDPTIKEIVIDYGEPSIIYRHCGPDIFLGFAQCDKCKLKGPKEYCARYIVHNVTRQQGPTVTIVR